MDKDWDQPPQADADLEHRFFHATGGVMVVGTLIAGAIMLWLAANTQAPSTNFAADRNVPAMKEITQEASQLARVIPVAEAPRLHSGQDNQRAH